MGPNYSVLCRTTVTVYDKDNYAKTIYRAHADFKKVQSIDKTGSTEVNNATIVIPKELNGISNAPVKPGDRVYIGEGPDIADRAEWAQFIPSKVAGLVVARYVDPKYYRGVLVHWEIGG